MVKKYFMKWLGRADINIPYLEAWQKDLYKQMLEKAYRAGYEKGRRDFGDKPARSCESMLILEREDQK